MAVLKTFLNLGLAMLVLLLTATTINAVPVSSESASSESMSMESSMSEESMSVESTEEPTVVVVEPENPDIEVIPLILVGQTQQQSGAVIEEGDGAIEEGGAGEGGETEPESSSSEESEESLESEESSEETPEEPNEPVDPVAPVEPVVELLPLTRRQRQRQIQNGGGASSSSESGSSEESEEDDEIEGLPVCSIMTAGETMTRPCPAFQVCDTGSMITLEGEGVQHMIAVCRRSFSSDISFLQSVECDPAVDGACQSFRIFGADITLPGEELTFETFDELEPVVPEQPTGPQAEP